MDDLAASSPAAGLAPLHLGGASLSEVAPGPVWALLPYRGQTAALSAAMAAAHGPGFPAPGRIETARGVAAAFAGLDQALLLGTAPDPALAAHAALVDCSDAWCRLALSGPAAAEILARLVPVDLSPRAAPPGTALRTALGHMAALILCRAEGDFEILVFRSMAGSAVHEITRAMRMVAARAAAQ